MHYLDRRQKVAEILLQLTRGLKDHSRLSWVKFTIILRALKLIILLTSGH